MLNFLRNPQSPSGTLNEKTGNCENRKMEQNLTKKDSHSCTQTSRLRVIESSKIRRIFSWMEARAAELRAAIFRAWYDVCIKYNIRGGRDGERERRERFRAGPRCLILSPRLTRVMKGLPFTYLGGVTPYGPFIPRDFILNSLAWRTTHYLECKSSTAHWICRRAATSDRVNIEMP